MRTARSPAFLAFPTPTVATGMPSGICTIESSESSPSSCCNGTGTPITGSDVIDAVIPGRWAAPPAPAMITRKPRSAAPRAYSYITSGVRCADTTRTSCAIPKSVSTSTAPCITGRSESLPMITPTSGAPLLTSTTLAAELGPGALFGEVGFVHPAHETLEVHLGRPAELLARLGRVAHQQVDLGRTFEARILAD